MFEASTSKLEAIAKKHDSAIKEIEKLLCGNVYMYIDYANVRPWADKLKWHIDLKRLKQFLSSFKNILAINFYIGTLEGDEKSEQEAGNVKQYGYCLRTKPVKIMNFSIKAKGVAPESVALLEQFIRKSLLRKYRGETIEYLNQRFAEMNKLGEYVIEDRKCNFDVEIGVDMLLNAERECADTFVLWSGDSDFHDPIKKLLSKGKKVILFATSRRVARELNNLKSDGLVIFDIKKIREFICWNREIDEK